MSYMICSLKDATQVLPGWHGLIRKWVDLAMVLKHKLVRDHVLEEADELIKYRRLIMTHFSNTLPVFMRDLLDVK